MPYVTLLRQQGDNTMKRVLNVAMLAALALTTVACAGLKISDSEMTFADVKARETAIAGGFTVSDERTQEIINDTPSLKHLHK
jgi:hypothetical protein